MQDYSKKDPNQKSSSDQSDKPNMKKRYVGTRTSFILKTVLTFLIIFLLKNYISDLRFFLLFFAPLLAFLFIWLKSIHTGDCLINVIKDYITFIPVAYTEKEWKYSRKIWITYVIILVNVLIYYGLLLLPQYARSHIYDLFMCLPKIEGRFNSLASPLFSIFLHASVEHLWWNMLFLWIFGVVVERRVGWKRFIILYLGTGILANLFYVLFYRTFMHQTHHIIGASGAIAGIMGVFMVRLYFKKMVFPIPILGIFSFFVPIGLKIRINSMIVIGIFFVADLTAGIQQVHGASSNIGYWAHISGMISGILLALLKKFHEDAFEEMHTEMGVQAMEQGKMFVNGEKSLRIVLEKNPKNKTALLYLARKKSELRLTEEGYDLYCRLIKILMKSDHERAAEIFVEYFRKYWRNIDANIQYRMAEILFRKGDYDTSTRAMEMLIDDKNVPKEVREKVLMQLARVLESINFQEAAMFRYEQFIDLFPDSLNVETMKKRLTLLKWHFKT
jgi:membrane associated rhomboid family serine protease